MARFTKLDSKGKALPLSAKDWSAVRESQHRNGDARKKPVVWDRKFHGRFTLAQQDAFLATHKVCGKKAAAPALVDLFELAPRTDAELAEFKRYFDHEPNWFRSAEKYAPSSDCRWGVYFSGGHSYDLYGGNDCFVRAVRASQ